MAKLIDQSICTGCSACVACCPRDAITMSEDVEGFLMPTIDAKKCVDCGLCVKTCPVLSEHLRDESPSCYAAKANDAELVRQSSSGGLFSVFAMDVLSRGGVVYGAAYVGENLDVKHIRVNSQEGLASLRGSKYVYSETNTIYRSVREDLKTRPVLFSGTPCQIAGLKAYLKREYDNLLAVELICHGTPPARLFNGLKREMSELHGRLTGISFRDKAEGWGSRAMTGWYASGEKIRETGNLNDYFKAFIAHLTLRHSCEDCRFNDGKSGADVTLGDFWGVTNTIPDLNDNTGVSAVLLHSAKATAIFERLDCYKQKVDLSDITPGNPSYQAPRTADKNRNAFMAMANAHGIHVAKKRFMREAKYILLRRIYRKIKNIAGGGVNSVVYPLSLNDAIRRAA